MSATQAVANRQDTTAATTYDAIIIGAHAAAHCGRGEFSWPRLSPGALAA